MKDERREMDEMSGLFTGPAIRTLFGRVIAPPGAASASDDIKRARAAQMVEEITSRYYIIEERRFDESGIFMRVKVDPDSNEGMFDDLRRALKKHGLFPRLVQERGRNFILVFPLPKRKGKTNTVNLVLLIATIFTTVWAGSILWMSRTEELSTMADIVTVLFDPEYVFMGGLTFAFPLLLILGTHELGHYFTSRRYGIDATLPYFIPIPPFISPIGTFGALISMKEPISNKKALIDIGAAGPIAGFIVAIPVTIIGLLLTKAYPVSMDLASGETVMIINPPLLFHGFMALLGVPDEGVLYPTAFAGWLGLFVTALNLLPVGQLDGGHIIRGALGEKSRFISTGAMVLMVILGIVTGFITYIFFAILILILGARHPPPLDDISPLSKRQWLVFGLSIGIMALTFHPIPLEQMKVEGEGLMLENEWNEHFASPNTPNWENYTLVNDDRSLADVNIQITIGGGLPVAPTITNKTLDVGEGWGNISKSSYFVYKQGGWYILLMGSKNFEVKGGEEHIVPFVLGCSLDNPPGNSTMVEITFIYNSDKELRTSFDLVNAPVFIELAQEDYYGSRILNGTIWNLDEVQGTSNISMYRKNATGTGTVIFHTVESKGVEWGSKEPLQLVVGPGEWIHLGSVEWVKTSGDSSNAAFFTLELDKNTKAWPGEDIIIHLNGPGNLTAIRGVRVH
ncbi:MAG: site-2 protease family protein [Thermoplasmatota archaeon]